MPIKQCAWAGCETLAAYGTRTKPAWCDQHITAILNQGGLEPLAPFTTPTAYRLARCQACGCEAHYRFVYTIDKNSSQERTCRACYWSNWTNQALELGAIPVGADVVSDVQARKIAESHGYNYLGPAPIPPAYRVCCRYCGRITADRLGDIAWGCSCQVNPKRSRLAKPLSKPEAVKPNSDLLPRLKPELVAQWHPTKNAPLRVADISPNSRRQIYWYDPNCGHEWIATPAAREKRERLRCPECRTILDSLAWHFSDIAGEWSVDNPLSAWHVRPSGSLPFIPEWVCADDPSHRWRIAANLRVRGSNCPQCRESGKSMVELRYFDAIRLAFGEGFSGLTLRSEAFERRSTWTSDITVHLSNGRTLLVEYDGSYWHAAKENLDTDKSRDLLAAGYLVVRIREVPLPSLKLSSNDYFEVPVNSTALDPESAIAEIRSWLAAKETDGPK